MAARLDSVTITVPKLAPAVDFYDAVLGALGLVRVVELVDEEEDEPPLEAVGWGSADGAGCVWLVTGTPATSGLHLRFRADSRVQIETFFAAGVASGGAPHTEPRRWTIYRRGDFNAIVADPLGNLVEAVAPE